jgi:hypothetical protein
MRQPGLPRPSPGGVSLQVVSEMMATSVQAQTASMQAMIEASSKATTASVLEQMAPLLKLLHDGVRTNAQGEDARKVEASLDRAAAREAAEAAREAGEELELQSARQVLEAQQEQDRVNKALPPRSMRPDVEVRMRGGAQRAPSRTELARRLMESSGDLTAEELEEYAEVLQRGHQVPSTHVPSPPVVSPFSLGGVGAAGRASRSAPALFAHLQHQGLAPPTAGEEAMRAVAQVFKAMGEKESKKAAAVASYKDFAEFIRTSKVLTRDAHDADPTSYWQMHWHFQSVHHIFATSGWEVAGAYHALVMKDWQEGFLDIDAMVDTEECRRGDLGGALHQRFFLTAQHNSKAKKAGPTKAAYPSHGTKEKAKPTDTWCAHCGGFFPVEKSHKTSTCRKKMDADKAKG